MRRNIPVAKHHQPVWTDRQGEAWPCVADAARALSLPPTSVLAAVREGWSSYAGRQWFGEPAEWALSAAVEAERQRAASVRCNPGRNGYVLNGVDCRTGKVYAGGREVTEREGATA